MKKNVMKVPDKNNTLQRRAVIPEMVDFSAEMIQARRQ